MTFLCQIRTCTAVQYRMFDALNRLTASHVAVTTQMAMGDDEDDVLSPTAHTTQCSRKLTDMRYLFARP